MIRYITFFLLFIGFTFCVYITVGNEVGAQRWQDRAYAADVLARFHADVVAGQEYCDSLVSVLHSSVDQNKAMSEVYNKHCEEIMYLKRENAKLRHKIEVLELATQKLYQLQKGDHVQSD